jgi:HK97 family phage major capsid protein
MSNDTLTAIELLKDGNERFIFRDDVNGEFDGYILGYPVDVSDNMPEIASKADVIYFGDMSGLALKQRDDALEMQVLREKYATQHAIGINAWTEMDAKVENEQKIAKLTMA